MFRRGINSCAGYPNQACHRRVIDDGAATGLEHLRNLILHRQPDTLDVDVHDVVIVFHGLIRCRTAPPFDACVVERNIEFAVGFHGVFDQCFDIILGRNIGTQEAGFTTRLLNRCDNLRTGFNTAVTDDDLRTLPRERQSSSSLEGMSATLFACLMAICW